MDDRAGRCGASIISWSQTEIDGQRDAPVFALLPESFWCWTGEPVTLGSALDVPPGDAHDTPSNHRRRTAAAARCLLARALGKPSLPRTAADRTFTLTDGPHRWVVTELDVPGLAKPLLLFDAPPPSPVRPLQILRVDLCLDEPAWTPAAGVVGFTPETWIETPGGARQLQHLVGGDKVETLDAGVQEIVWIGAHRITSDALRRTPDLTPVRIREGAMRHGRPDGDLVVSPDHRVLMRFHHGGAETRVLVPTRDLVDGKGVIRDARSTSVLYVHILLERHHILIANGIETESFHPTAANFDAISEPDRGRLLDVLPFMASEPGAYGPTAHPVLSGAEAAFLNAA